MSILALQFRRFLAAAAWLVVVIVMLKVAAQ
jgi:hypothetical protein